MMGDPLGSMPKFSQMVIQETNGEYVMSDLTRMSMKKEKKKTTIRRECRRRTEGVGKKKTSPKY